MTSELEQEFFRVFGIDEQCICPYFPEYMENGCEICIKYFQGKKDCNEKNRYKYPDITAEKLLQMICILSAYNYIFEDLKADNIEQLKEEIIKLFFDYPFIAEEEKTNIQQLFKEVSEW